MHHHLQVFARAAALALALLCAAFAGGALSSCSSMRSEPDPTWEEGEVTAISRDVLFNMTFLALKSRDFPRGTEVDPNIMSIESGWKNQLQPFRGQGTRKKVVVNFTRVDGNRWLARVRIKSQANMAIVNQLDLSYAEWEWRDDDATEARVLLQYLRSSLGG